MEMSLATSSHDTSYNLKRSLLIETLPHSSTGAVGIFLVTTSFSSTGARLLPWCLLAHREIKWVPMTTDVA